MNARLKAMFQFLAGINATALVVGTVLAGIVESAWPSWPMLLLIALASVSIPVCIGGARLAQQERDRQAAMPWTDIMEAYGRTVPRR